MATLRVRIKTLEEKNRELTGLLELAYGELAMVREKNAPVGGAFEGRTSASGFCGLSGWGSTEEHKTTPTSRSPVIQGESPKLRVGPRKQLPQGEESTTPFLYFLLKGRASKKISLRMIRPSLNVIKAAARQTPIGAENPYHRSTSPGPRNRTSRVL